MDLGREIALKSYSVALISTFLLFSQTYIGIWSESCIELQGL